MSTLLKIIWYCSLVYIPETIGLLLLISTGVQKKFRLDKATGCLLVFATGMYIISNFEHMEILFYLWNYLLLYLMYYFYTYYYTKKFKTAIYVVIWCLYHRTHPDGNIIPDRKMRYWCQYPDSAIYGGDWKYRYLFCLLADLQTK